MSGRGAKQDKEAECERCVWEWGRVRVEGATMNE